VLAEGEAKDLLVNILIRDNKLEVISQDTIPIEEGANAIDGREGYVLGNLVIGETPSFVILNQDPRENFEVILDTSFFTVFAVHNGQLVQNNLFEVAEEEIAAEEEQAATAGWRAYNPPPMALPLNYLDTTKFNRWDSKWVSGLFVAGIVLDRMHWGSQDADSEAHHGSLGWRRDSRVSCRRGGHDQFREALGVHAFWRDEFVRQGLRGSTAGRFHNVRLSARYSDLRECERQRRQTEGANLTRAPHADDEHCDAGAHIRVGCIPAVAKLWRGRER
jgi:hypothetical protein